MRILRAIKCSEDSFYYDYVINNTVRVINTKEGLSLERNTFATIMARYHEKYSVQKKDIYKGICSPSTYLRIEMEGKGDFLLQESLLARVGLSATNFELLLEDEEYELWSERLAIQTLMAGRKYEDVQKRIATYRCIHAQKHKLHEQFCLYYEMKLEKWRASSPEYICQLAQKGLSITKDLEEYPEVNKNLFTPIEMELLLILIQYKYGNWKSAWKREGILMKIIEYVDYYYDEENREILGGIAWLELVRMQEQCGELEKKLEYVDKAINYLLQGKDILRLAELRFIKAQILYEMSEETSDERYYQQCKRECRLAYNIYGVMECQEEKDIIQRFYKEKL